MPPTQPFATTEHLNLRGFRETDLELIHELTNDPRVLRTLTTSYIVPATPKFTQDKMGPLWENSLAFFVLEAKEGDGAAKDEEPLPNRGEVGEGRISKGDTTGKADATKWAGFVSLRMSSPKNRDADLGIAVQPRWWGRGFGTEAVQWIVDYAFNNLALHRVTLEVVDGNDRAVSLYKKVGFKEEGRSRQSVWFEGRWVDYVSMGILDHEWRDLRK